MNTSDGSRPMARNERQEDEGRGSVSTITRVSTTTRPGVRQRPPATVRPATPRPAPANAQAAPANAQAAPNVRAAPSARPADHPVTAPTARPGAVPTARPGAVPTARPGATPTARPSTAPRPGSHRLPFVLLLCGLLGGALISALVISTTLAEGAFQITNLENATGAQAKQLQSLEEEVALAQSPVQIQTRAAKLGMVGPEVLRFIDLKTGKTVTDADPNWVGSIPGYYP
jgi:hypothetical protein